MWFDAFWFVWRWFGSCVIWSGLLSVWSGFYLKMVWRMFCMVWVTLGETWLIWQVLGACLSGLLLYGLVYFGCSLVHVHGLVCCLAWSGLF